MLIISLLPILCAVAWVLHLNGKWAFLVRDRSQVVEVNGVVVDGDVHWHRTQTFSYFSKGRFHVSISAMKLLMSCFYLAFAFFPFNAFAQKPTADSRAPAYLLRIDRVWEHRDVCMLVNRDGAYRLERIFPGKTEVSAGTLSDTKLHELMNLLNADSLQRLTQDDVGHNIAGIAVDDLTLSIGRSTFVQELAFIDEAARSRFRQTIDPILKWYDEAQELPGTKLSESSASRCLPPPRREARENSRQYSWMVQFATNEVFVERAERVCAVVQTNGEFRRERQQQEPGKPSRDTVYEGKLTEQQVGELRSIVDDPNLAKIPSQEHPYTSWFAEGRFTTVNIPRPAGIQTLASSSYYKVAHDPAAAGGMAGVHTQFVNENASLKPLKTWFERNIMKMKLQPVTSLSANGCRPRP